MMSGGVGVGVEVDDADVAPAMAVGDRRCGWPRDRVVTADDDREDAAAGDLTHTRSDVSVRALGQPVRAVRVAEVDHLEVLEDLDVEIEMVCRRVVRL